jgi:EAL domain-containing protein (putative c-di-GMP-specific phosphodiesterase class I)
LKDIFPIDSIVGRIDGDEFGIIIKKNKNSLEIINNVIRKISVPFIISNEETYVTVCMGISEFPEDASTFKGLLRTSNNALNTLKRSGNKGYQFYSSSIEKDTNEKYSIVKNLRKAVVKNELFFMYQPQIDSRTNKVIGVEALMRWKHDGEMISPLKFIPLAEESNLIYKIGEWGLEEAIKFGSMLHNQNHKISIAVNLSVMQIKEPDIVDRILAILNKYHFDPSYLDVEITESVLIEGELKVNETLQKLKENGMKISIDDFGTGYSSLSYLHKYSFDKLKIDRSFIKDYPNQSDGKIASLLVKLAESLGSDVIAEGVEELSQIEFLNQVGCYLIQGYYYSKPLTTDELIDLLKRESIQN